MNNEHREVLSLKNFNEYKKQLLQLYEKFNVDGDAAYFENLIEDVARICFEIAKFDLSEIAFDQWDGLSITSTEKYPVDFSGTKAKIDFSKVNVDSDFPINFFGCDIRNAQNYSKINDDSFDQKAKNENPDAFISSVTDVEIRNKYFNKTLSFTDLFKLNDEQINQILLNEEKTKYIQGFYFLTHVCFFTPKKILEYSRENLELLNSIEETLESVNYFYIGITSDNQVFNSIINQDKDTLSLTDLKQLTFDLLKKTITSATSKNYQDVVIPELFKKENPDLFSYENSDLPEDIKQRFFAKQLTIGDLYEYNKFQSIPNIWKYISKDYEIEKEIINILINKYSQEEFKKILNNYDVIFKSKVLASALNFFIESFSTSKKPCEVAFLEFLNDINSYDSKISFLLTEVVHKHNIDESYKTIFKNNKIFEFENNYGILNFLGDYEKKIFYYNNDTLEKLQKFEMVSNYEAYVKLINKEIYNLFLTDNNFKINENMPEAFKKQYPNFFFTMDVPTEIKSKYYKREFTLNDFKQNPDWINYFQNTNLTYGLANDYSYLSFYEDFIEENYEYSFKNMASIIKQLKEIEDNDLKSYFIEYYNRFSYHHDIDKIKIANLDNFIIFLKKLQEINLLHVLAFKKISSDIINSDTPKEFYEKLQLFLEMIQKINTANLIGVYIENCNVFNQLLKFDDPEISLYNLNLFISIIQKINDANLIEIYYPGCYIDEIMDFEFQDETLFKVDVVIEIVTKLKNENLLGLYREKNPMLMEIIKKSYDRDNDDIDYFIYLVKKLESKESLFLLDKKNINWQEIIDTKNFNVINKKVDDVINLSQRFRYSNSSEICQLWESMFDQVLNLENPSEAADKMEKLFTANDIPTVGKVFKFFEILFPNLQESEKNTVSPMLQKSTTNEKKMILFSDLIKNYFGSNNRSVNQYIDVIDRGSYLFDKLKNDETLYEKLSNEEKELLSQFRNKVKALFEFSKKGSQTNLEASIFDNPIRDIKNIALEISPNGTLDYNLADRLVYMFCGLAGIKTMADAKNFISQKVVEADKRNREAALDGMVLEPGDFIRGVGDVKYIETILQNGSNCKQFLGTNIKTDYTPYDIDLCKIGEGATTEIKLKNIENDGYGPIFFVYKNDERFVNTRDGKNDETSVRRNLSKYEVFYTGVLSGDHVGIRTGLPTSEINYICMESYDDRVALAIALNGFYIPIYNFKGKIVFTPDDYDALREKMSGLGYYGLPEYKISDNLSSPEIEETKNEVLADYNITIAKNKYVFGLLTTALNNCGISRTSIGFHEGLDEGLAEIYSTGSTARNTNVPNDSDYDYIIKIDNSIYSDSKKYADFKEKFKQYTGFIDIVGGKIGGTIKSENGDDLDVEISFCQRTDKMEFSTDAALETKLEAIKSQYPDKYEDVIANIVYAKKLFKENHIYKSLKSDSTQGGLGGIGIENWILQHGGSFADAARSFVEIAESCKSFEEFKEKYQVWDFGNNHYAFKRDAEGKDQHGFAHDNFVGGYDKMGLSGYEKMLTVLKEYLRKLDKQDINDNDIGSSSKKII